MNFKQTSQAVEKAVVKINQEFKLFNKKNYKKHRNHHNLDIVIHKIRILKEVSKESEISEQHLVNVGCWREFDLERLTGNILTLTEKK